MLGGTGLKGRGGMSTIARQRLMTFSRSSRSISSFRPQASRFPIRYGGLNQGASGNLSWKPASSISGACARFNSTTSTASAASASTVVSASDNVAATTTETGVSDLSDLSVTDINSIPEKIGYLKELGLDYGWGPSSMIEFVIEHFHMWGGLPWWASIVGTGLLIRLALLGPMLGAADTSTKINNIKHISTPLRTKMMHYAREGNNIEMAKSRADLQKLHSDHGVKAWKSFVPMLQIPLGFGCYRVVKGMTALPVPGLTTESVGWLTDLTVADPYFILPAATSFMMYLTFRKGGEAGMNEFKNSVFGKVFLYGLPCMTFAFMNFFPSALQLYFVSTGLFALGQSYMLSSHSFRRLLNIAIPQTQPSSAAPGNTPAASGGSQQSKALRMLSDALEAERSKVAQQGKKPESFELSFIDRAINSFKETKDTFKRETTEKINEMRGEGPLKNEDGSPAEPPRLSEKDRKLAADYEKRRREEEEWKREERNHARREAHLRAVELEREKARRSFKVKQR